MGDNWTLARVVGPGGRPRSGWQIGTPEEWSENHVIEVVEVVPANQLRGAVEALRETAETLHRVSPWWEHAERTFEDCPAESCVKARTALGGQ